MRIIVLDLDDVRGSLLLDGPAFRDTVAAYRRDGFSIVLSAGRDGPDLAAAQVRDWAAEIDALASLCDSVVFGRPSAGQAGWTLDDKAVTPEEFLAHGYDEIRRKLDAP
jgi:hypothetical protein